MEFAFNKLRLKSVPPQLPLRLDVIDTSSLLNTVSQSDQESTAEEAKEFTDRVLALHSTYVARSHAPSRQSHHGNHMHITAEPAADSRASTASTDWSRLDPIHYPGPGRSVNQIDMLCKPSSPGPRYSVEEPSIPRFNKSRWNSYAHRLPPAEPQRSPGPIYTPTDPRGPASQFALGAIKISESVRRVHNGLSVKSYSIAAGSDEMDATMTRQSYLKPVPLIPFSPSRRLRTRAKKLLHPREGPIQNPYTVRYTRGL